MASTIASANITVSFKARQVGDNDFGGGGEFNPALIKAFDFINGTGANQFDRLFCDKRTLAASGTENLDLNAVLLDVFGAAIAAVELVGVIVYAAAANTNNVVIGGAASNPVPMFADATDKVVIKPGGIFVLIGPNAAGICTITAATGDLLLVANSGGTTGVDYEIVLLLRSS